MAGDEHGSEMTAVLAKHAWRTNHYKIQVTSDHCRTFIFYYYLLTYLADPASTISIKVSTIVGSASVEVSPS